jgi:F0F1-type ATP synthase membrane subunit c/vacuolar-type H+-ATPase subunit K
MENFAHVQAMTVLAVGIIFGLGALGTAIPSSPRCCR